MKYADEYYERLKKTQAIRERKVFVATDDVVSIEEITKRYTAYILRHNFFPLTFLRYIDYLFQYVTECR